MASLNQCSFIGNAGKDAELKFTPKGDAVAKFSLAVNHKAKDVEATEWVNVVLFGATAENLSQYITKGKPLYIQGRMQTRSWDDDQGNKHYMTEIIANTVQLLGSRDDAPSAPRQRPTRPTPAGDIDVDDLPFE